jgi:hypothetical protein
MRINIGDPSITRAYVAKPDATRAQGMGTAIKFVATTEGMKRDGLDLRLEGLDTSNFERNPVFLWAHNYAMPPLGKVVKIRRLKKRIEMHVEFDQGDDFAVDVERKYREGFLTAVSIGWIITEYERGVEGTDEADYIITGADLLDLSAVPVPGDADALMPRELAAVRSMAAARSPAAPDGLPAHGPSASGAAGTLTEELCDHVDDDGPVWSRVAAAMARLLSDGDLSDDERDEQYRHLDRHYRHAGRTIPELLPGIVLADIDVRQLFVEGEWLIYQEEQLMTATERARAAIDAMRAAADDLEAVFESDDAEAATTENQSFVDLLGGVRDAIVLPTDDQGDDDDE